MRFDVEGHHTCCSTCMHVCNSCTDHARASPFCTLISPADCRMPLPLLAAASFFCFSCSTPYARSHSAHASMDIMFARCRRVSVSAWAVAAESR